MLVWSVSFAAFQEKCGRAYMQHPDMGWWLARNQTQPRGVKLKVQMDRCTDVAKQRQTPFPLFTNAHLRRNRGSKYVCIDTEKWVLFAAER